MLIINFRIDILILIELDGPFLAVDFILENFIFKDLSFGLL